MLVEYLGNDLKMISNQIDKLKLLNPENNKITPELIEKNISEFKIISSAFEILYNNKNPKKIIKELSVSLD